MIDYSFMQRRLNQLVNKYGIEGAMHYTDYCGDQIYLGGSDDYSLIEACNDLHWSWNSNPIIY